MSIRRALFATAAFAGAVLAVTACGPADVVPDPRPATHAATSPAAPAPGAAAPGATGTGAAAPGAALPPGGTAATGASRGSGAGGSGTPAGAGGSDGDAYAYTHPCETGNLSLRVTTRPQAPTQRVIEVRNQGPKACGLSYYPLVSLGAAGSADRSKDVRPLVPGGLGGAPAYPLASGRTAYAVIDLNPGGAATGTVPGIDQLNVLVDGDHMPTAETRNVPLGPDAKVLKPKLGLYRASTVEAAASTATADQPS